MSNDISDRESMFAMWTLEQKKEEHFLWTLDSYLLRNDTYMYIHMYIYIYLYIYIDTYFRNYSSKCFLWICNGCFQDSQVSPAIFQLQLHVHQDFGGRLKWRFDP